MQRNLLKHRLKLMALIGKDSELKNASHIELTLRQHPIDSIINLHVQRFLCSNCFLLPFQVSEQFLSVGFTERSANGGLRSVALKKIRQFAIEWTCVGSFLHAASIHLATGLSLAQT